MRQPGDPTHLHVLDQRGGYYTVDAAGNVEMVERGRVGGSKGWSHLGTVAAPPPFGIDPPSGPMEELWRTHVPGAVGFYNAIVIADLDGDPVNELYIAGSYGLWRFVRPPE